ncbi:hypothetical protein ABT269_05410 [Streptomyces viridosporus]|uniref:hypothetical protein n=1 Tax=Streptomyces viridosporus TaxID=67581 RepID=UPI003332D91C
MEVQRSVLCVEEAEEAVEELRAALAKAGITLPSLGLDPVSLAREAPCPLVELGRCSAETARRIAAAVTAVTAVAR